MRHDFLQGVAELPGRHRPGHRDNERLGVDAVDVAGGEVGRLDGTGDHRTTHRGLVVGAGRDRRGRRPRAQVPDRLTFQHVGHGDLESVSLEAGHDLDGLDRVTAQGEEVGVGTVHRHAEDLGPHLGHDGLSAFEGGSRAGVDGYLGG